MVDRVLVSAHAQGLEAAIVLNKCDLISPGTAELDEVQARLEPYERIGYPVLRTSAQTGDGVLELRTLLSGKTSILIGNSGVGKSHLLNCLSAGQIQARVGEINSRLRLGTHTTTTSTLHRLPPRENGEEDGSLLIDSPGARRFSIWDVEAEDLKDHFVEFLPLARHCRFRSCDHLNTPDCAVKDAVQMAQIPLERYKRYARIRECLLAGREGDIDGLADQLTTGGSDLMLPAEIREYEPLREYRSAT
jgi:ribosome biogenesis GTPase